MLLYQLFKASKSERIKRKRRKSRLVNPVLFLVLALPALPLGNYIFAALMAIGAVLWYFFYPVYEAGHYRRHYQAFVKEIFGVKLAGENLLRFDDDFIYVTETGAEMKLANTQLEVLHETGDAVYAILKTGGVLILPKSKIANTAELIPWLKHLAQDLKIVYTQEPGWEWK
jgi:hypothetical protein